jgi:carotenoid 1,2-hydratase
MSQPAFAFDGVGYHDTNAGSGRLERAFSRWTWARFHAAARTTVLYAVTARDGAARALVVDVADEGGERRAAEARLAQEGGLRDAGWGLRLPERFALTTDGGTFRCEPGTLLAPAPFYARYLGRLDAPGRAPTPGVGEHLDLDRFSARGVQFLVRFRTRRVS